MYYKPALDLSVPRSDDLLRDRVVRAVSDAIASGALSPGQRLTERQLTELTGVSRTSVREALRHLEALNLIETDRKRGLRVVALSLEAVRHVFEVRGALEPFAAELFTMRATDDEVREILSLRDPLPEVAEDRLVAARKVDRLLTTGARNPVLAEVLEPLYTRIHALRRISLQIPGRLSASEQEYRELFSAISAREPGRAREASARHVLAAAEAALAAVAVLISQDALEGSTPSPYTSR